MTTQTKHTQSPAQVKIASPLFILRHLCEKDLFAVLTRIKELGYDGVEFLGFFGQDPTAIRRKLDEIGLVALGNHVDYQTFRDHVEKTIADHLTIGCRYITIGGLSQQQYQDPQLLADFIENVTRIGKACRDQGLTLLYHNHSHELKIKLESGLLLDAILDRAPAESLSFEPDLGWIAIGGGSPEFYLDKYQDRCPVIHLKDYYADDTRLIGNISELNGQKGDEKHSFFEFRPTGYGVANTPALLKKAMKCNPEWFVADHDLAYERDIFDDLKLSLDFIKNLVSIS